MAALHVLGGVEEVLFFKVYLRHFITLHHTFTLILETFLFEVSSKLLLYNKCVAMLCIFRTLFQ